MWVHPMEIHGHFKADANWCIGPVPALEILKTCPPNAESAASQTCETKLSSGFVRDAASA